jgi:heme oxygenase
MDLSIRKQQTQQQPSAALSRPILNPATSTSMLQGSTSRDSLTLPSHNSVHQYVPVQQRLMQQSKYVQLLNVIEEMGKDIKPTYAGNKNSAERLRRAIASARILVRECQLECDRNSRL